MDGRSEHPPAHFNVLEQRDWYAKRCDDLRHEVDVLRATKFQDDSAFLTQSHILAEACGLRPSWAFLLCAMWRSRGKPVSRVKLAQELPAVSVNSDDRDLKIIDVYVCAIRKKLGRDNLINHWGLGYSLTPEVVAQIDEIMAQRGYAQRGAA